MGDTPLPTVNHLYQKISDHNLWIILNHQAPQILTIFSTTATDHMGSKYVHNKFTTHSETIQSICQRDATFREICEDYAEVCAWLEDYCRRQGRPSEECDHARQLLKELEAEIMQVLRDAGFDQP